MDAEIEDTLERIQAQHDAMMTEHVIQQVCARIMAPQIAQLSKDSEALQATEVVLFRFTLAAGAIIGIVGTLGVLAVITWMTHA